MRILLNPVVVRELDQVILRPGRSLMRAFYGPVVITPAGEAEVGRKPGLLAEEQPLVDNPDFALFWMKAEVLGAAAKCGSFPHWLEHNCDLCQWEHSDDCYHHNELINTRYEDSFLRLCWHHDRVLIDLPPSLVAAIARRNAARYVIDSVRIHFRHPDHHIITVSDMGCWAMVHRIAECLPESAIRHILRLPDAEPFKSVYRECDLQVNPPDPHGIIAAAVKEAPVLSVAVEPDAPAQYMRRPKIPRWECQQYTEWVKMQPCCGCGQPGDDPHHLIGHGFGGTGTKAGDFHVMPMCRICHRELHDNVAAWERQHGSQLEHILRLQHRALGLGIIVMGGVN